MSVILRNLRRAFRRNRVERRAYEARVGERLSCAALPGERFDERQSCLSMQLRPRAGAANWITRSLPGHLAIVVALRSDCQYTMQSSRCE